MNENIVIYVKQGCPYCVRAKKLLDQKGIQYKEIDIVKNSDLFNKIKSEYNVKTVPQIFITDENGNYIQHIAGSDKLIELEIEGKLDDMLHSGRSTNVTMDTNHNVECEEYHLSNNGIDDLI